MGMNQVAGTMTLVELVLSRRFIFFILNPISHGFYTGPRITWVEKEDIPDENIRQPLAENQSEKVALLGLARASWGSLNIYNGEIV